MKCCQECGDIMPHQVTIEGKIHLLSNRKRCFVCSPFKSKMEQSHNASIKERRIRSDKWKKQNNQCVSRRRKKVMKMAIEYKGAKCCICGYSKCSRALTFHHVDPTIKKFNISSGTTKSWEKLRVELDKCVLLCANCHAEVEDGMTVSPKLTNPP